jgi:hypothetical protein
MANGGRATVASHGPQMANGGRATVESHGPQMANGLFDSITGAAGGRKSRGGGRPRGSKNKRPQRCRACFKAGRVPECFSCKGRTSWGCPHLR